jgi:hypothetical protein
MLSEFTKISLLRNVLFNLLLVFFSALDFLWWYRYFSGPIRFFLKRYSTIIARIYVKFTLTDSWRMLGKQKITLLFYFYRQMLALPVFFLVFFGSMLFFYTQSHCIPNKHTLMFGNLCADMSTDGSLPDYPDSDDKMKGNGTVNSGDVEEMLRIDEDEEEEEKMDTSTEQQTTPATVAVPPPQGVPAPSVRVLDPALPTDAAPDPATASASNTNTASALATTASSASVSGGENAMAPLPPPPAAAAASCVYNSYNNSIQPAISTCGCAPAVRLHRLHYLYGNGQWLLQLHEPAKSLQQHKER